jgi:predicted DNA-binding transcriptional regulator YafY
MLRRSNVKPPARKPAPAASPGQLEFEHVRREPGEPSSSLARCVAVLVRLLKMGSVEYDWYWRCFEMSDRQFTRDLQYLRAIGADLGIAISKKSNGRVTLAGFEGRNRLGEEAAVRDEALRAVARALGAPAAVELGAPEDSDTTRERFLIYGLPRLLPGTEVAGVYAALKAAQASRARVTFRYSDRNGTNTTRTVEPYRVLAHNGRYFLIAYDIAPRKAWRYFALDRIVAKPTRAGSFTPRPIPPQYTAGDAIGMLQRGGTTTEVTVRLSPVVAVSTISRSWQKNQRVERRRDGSADITLTVNDVEEVVRWSLGFGSEARIIAPPRAVTLARRCVADLQAAYAQKSETKRSATG